LRTEAEKAEDRAALENLRRFWDSGVFRSTHGIEEPLLLASFPDAKEHALFYGEGSRKDFSYKLKVAKAYDDETHPLGAYSSLVAQAMLPSVYPKDWTVTIPKCSRRVFKLKSAYAKPTPAELRALEDPGQPNPPRRIETRAFTDLMVGGKPMPVCIENILIRPKPGVSVAKSPEQVSYVVIDGLLNGKRVNWAERP
jgi:hypothetical protein